MPKPLLTLVLLLGALTLTPSVHSAEPRSRFKRDVRPLLEAHCFKCHSHKGGAINGGLASFAQWLGDGRRFGTCHCAGQAGREPAHQGSAPR